MQRPQLAGESIAVTLKLLWVLRASVAASRGTVGFPAALREVPDAVVLWLPAGWPRRW